jgi:hypothetical protein
VPDLLVDRLLRLGLRGLGEGDLAISASGGCAAEAGPEAARRAKSSACSNSWTVSESVASNAVGG